MFFNRGKKKPKHDATKSRDASASENRSDDLLTESLFEDEPPSARKRPKSEGIIIDMDSADIIDPGSADLIDSVVDAPPSASASQSAPKPAKNSWFSAKPKTAKAPKATPAARPKAASKATPLTKVEPPKARPAQKPARSKDPQAVFMVLEIVGGRMLYWRVSEQGVEPCEEIPAGAVAVSVTPGDLRFAVEGAISNRKAEALVLESAGEPVYLINRSKDHAAIYASPQLRFADLSYRVSPGVLLVDQLYAKESIAESAAIVGLQLKDPRGKDAIIILFYRAPSGELSRPQISLNPDNLEFVLSQFATINQVRQDSKLFLYDVEQLLAVVASATLYPDEPMLGSITVQSALRFGMVTSILLALGTSGWAGYTWRQIQSQAAELAILKQQTQTLSDQAKSLVEHSPSTLAKALSLPLDSILQRSQALWVPGSKVRVIADGSTSDYLIRLPLIGRASSHQAPALTDEGVVEQLRTQTMPLGCKRKSFEFSGALNEVSLNVHCEDPASALSRYRSR